ncbi:unnamed protein product [Durusdinium trenchii]
MGINRCDLCECVIWAYSEATECGCYDHICESCVEDVRQKTKCEYCEDGQSCRRCEMVVKDGAWLACPASDCPIPERLQDNCCESCWDGFLDDFGAVTGLVKVTSATTGDFIKQVNVFDNDRISKVRQEMAEHLSLPAASILSISDKVSSIAGKKPPAKPAAPTNVTQAQKVMIIDWLPGQQVLNRQTGDHGYRTLSCGHFSCVLACAEDRCQECEKHAAEAARKQLDKKRAKQARVEANHVLSDLEVLRSIKVRSKTVKDFISGLAAKAKANAPNVRLARTQTSFESTRPAKKQRNAGSVARTAKAAGSPQATSLQAVDAGFKKLCKQEITPDSGESCK